MNCNECGNETTNPKFCSKSCAGTYNGRKFPKRKLSRLCINEGCDKIVKSYRHQRCEEHFTQYKENKYLDKTLGEYRSRYPHLHISSMHAGVRGLARHQHRELLKMPCAHCGYSKHVELAHIKALSSFPDDALISEVNSRDNVIQLCPNCHWEMDHPSSG